MAAGLLDVDPHELCDSELAAGLLDLYRLQQRVEAVQRAFVAVAAQRCFWVADGAVSLGAWVEQRAGVPRAQVTAAVRLGLVLQTLPHAAAAGLSSDQLRLIVSCEPADPEQEALLVGFAQQHPWRDLVQLTRHWRALRDADGSEPAAEPATGSLHLSKLPDGWWDLHGRLRPDQGDVVAAALDAQVDQRLRARRDGDPADAGLAVSALRADALVDLVAQTMRRGPSDASVPDRYRVAVVISPEEPTSGAGPTRHNPSGETPGRTTPRSGSTPSGPTPSGATPSRPTPNDATPSWATPSRRTPSAEHCDASFYRAVISAEREVLDIGRETRRWPTHPPRHHPTRPRLRLPQLRPTTLLVRHPPQPSMGPRRNDLPHQRRHALPQTPHVHPGTTMDDRHRPNRPPHLPKTR